MTRWASFDCYGTLIDWNEGLRSTFAELWPRADAGSLLDRYHEIEPRVELDGALMYREVLTQSLVLLAESEGLELPSREEGALARSLPDWPPFPEVQDELQTLHDGGWRLAVLSNTDDDLLGASLGRIGVLVDSTVTARDAGSYKPAHGHWERFFSATGAERERHVHVAASLYHDVAPAEELGLRCVWINRLGEESDLRRAAELPDLTGLADALDVLVPA